MVLVQEREFTLFESTACKLKVLLVLRFSIFTNIVNVLVYVILKTWSHIISLPTNSCLFNV